MGLNANTRYAPIDMPTGIRAIRLAPAHDDDATIRCSLVSVDLDMVDDAKPTDPSIYYAALSYVWGDMSDPRTILLDERPFLVGRTLHQALIRSRRLFARVGMADQLLWVDAICINQEDIAERESQVKLMGRIYQQCDYVIVELGISASEADMISFLEFMSCVQEKREGAAGGGNDPRDEISFLASLLTVPQKFKLADLGISPPSSDAIKAGFQILMSRYYGRAWIRQEFTLSRTLFIQLGDVCVDASTLYGAISFLLQWEDNSVYRDDWHDFTAAEVADNTVSRLGAAMMTLLYQRVTLSKALSGRSRMLLSKILWSRASIATDPRDKIYSMLGLASDRERYLPHVSYSLSVEAVYHKFATLFVENGQAVDMLYQIDSRAIELGRRIPSWVPDWSAAGIHEHVTADPYDGMSDFCAAGIEAMAARLDQNGDRLCVKGIVFDTIASLTLLASATVDSDPAVLDTMIADGLSLAQSCLRGEYPTGESYAEVVFQTAVRGPSLTKASVDVNSLRAGFSALVRRLQRETSTRPLGDVLTLDAAVSSAISSDETLFAKSNAVLGGMVNRSFCATENGYFGLCPGGAKPGDRLAVLFGGMIPFVLRPQNKGQETVYAVVGNGYFHGLMHGEVLKLSSVERQEIVLV